jgi:uncharacterized protein YuzE
MIQISYDPGCDMAYISLTDDETDKYDYSVPLEKRKDTSPFVLDISKEKRLVGIEIFNASKYLPKDLIEHALTVKRMRDEPRDLAPGC